MSHTLEIHPVNKKACGTVGKVTPSSRESLVQMALRNMWTHEWMVGKGKQWRAGQLECIQSTPGALARGGGEAKYLYGAADAWKVPLPPR